MRRALLLLSVCVCGGLLVPAAATAAVPERLLQFPRQAQDGNSGEAGHLNNPRGIAANPENGHVFVSDLVNSRISEFTSWGAFVRAWGWGVSDGSDEPQVCGPATPELFPPAGLCQPGIK
jgi:hypothetical protein